MKINVTKVEWPEGKEGEGYPVTHFRGFSRSLDGSWDENANSDIRGEFSLALLPPPSLGFFWLCFLSNWIRTDVRNKRYRPHDARG